LGLEAEYVFTADSRYLHKVGSSGGLRHRLVGCRGGGVACPKDDVLDRLDSGRVVRQGPVADRAHALDAGNGLVHTLRSRGTRLPAADSERGA
jgi:hypothetical protein